MASRLFISPDFQIATENGNAITKSWLPATGWNSTFVMQVASSRCSRSRPQPPRLLKLFWRTCCAERVFAVLAEDQELSPSEASTILGISRPLVVLRNGPG